MRRLLAMVSLAALPLAASGAQIVPAKPTEFERVDLRLTTDACSFVPSSVRVAAVANVIRVTQQLNPCLVAGPVRIVDIRLGSFPVGDYAVEIYATTQASGAPVERLAFSVQPRAEIAVFPPPARPLTEYTGFWWSPPEAGWALFLYQSPLSNALFGAWLVYGAESRPEWYTLQNGAWTSYSTWSATVYKTSGPSLGGGTFDPRLVSIVPVGTATLDFTQSPGSEGRAQFRYEVNGVSATRTVQRFVY